MNWITALSQDVQTESDATLSLDNSRKRSTRYFIIGDTHAHFDLLVIRRTVLISGHTKINKCLRPLDLFLTSRVQLELLFQTLVRRPTWTLGFYQLQSLSQAFETVKWCHTFALMSALNFDNLSFHADASSEPGAVLSYENLPGWK